MQGISNLAKFTKYLVGNFILVSNFKQFPD